MSAVGKKSASLASLFAGTQTAAAYASHRPDYPPNVFTLLVENIKRIRSDLDVHHPKTDASKGVFNGFTVMPLVNSAESEPIPHLAAIDIACGSGQATKSLVKPPVSCEKVLAVDVSAAQIAAAKPLPNTKFLVGDASKLKQIMTEEHIDNIDLLTCAQGLHWFDLHKDGSGDAATFHSLFSAQDPARRPLLAAWGYDNPILEHEEANRLVNGWLYQEQLDKYWSSRRVDVNDMYEDLQKCFPSDQVRRAHAPYAYNSF